MIGFTVTKKKTEKNDAATLSSLDAQRTDASRECGRVQRMSRVQVVKFGNLRRRFRRTDLGDLGDDPLGQFDDGHMGRKL